MIKCHECDKPAEWNVWYEGVDFGPEWPNIAYNSFCTEHTLEEIENGRGGYDVECVKKVYEPET